MRTLGNKVAARNLAVSVGAPVMPATEPLPDDPATIKRLAAEIGYPVMLKASWGGGGRGMRPIDARGAAARRGARSARREAKAAFGKDEVYLEKLVRRARHVEVQLLGDTPRQPRPSVRARLLDPAPPPEGDRARAGALSRRRAAGRALCEAALKIGRATDYVGAGTVEFLMDADTGAFYFIEVNPRIQVEHTVTEVVTGLDIVKAQIKIAEGGQIGVLGETGIPAQKAIRLNGHALQCRITTENPENNFIPDYGRITAYRGAFGFGIRVDGGTAYSGAVVTRFYDPMLEKVTAWAPTPQEAIARMDRALREYRIRGVATNLAFLEALLEHPKFRANDYTTRFIDETPELFQLGQAARPRDQAADLHRRRDRQRPSRDVKGRARPRADARPPEPPRLRRHRRRPTAPSRCSTGSAPQGFADWMREQTRVLVTDTTMRDAHQSLLATRMRTFDIVACGRRLCARPAAAAVARMLGRRHLRRRDALPDRGSVGAAAR